MANITGGTYFLNPLALDYPILEWIETARQFCDEIILVDMGSTDGTRRAIRNRFGKRVTILRERWKFRKDYHEGIPRNRIVSAAQCSWIYLTDCDEILHEKNFSEISRLTKESTDIFRLPLLNFYGSCYLEYIDHGSEKPALFRNGVGLYFGSPSGQFDRSAHTLLIDKGSQKSLIARKWRKNKRVQSIKLYHYGKCRHAKGIAAAHKFYTLQDGIRRGIDVSGVLLKEEDYVVQRPIDPQFVKWTGEHPRAMQEWVRKHWKIHGWEV